MRSSQRFATNAHTAAQAIKEGDRGGHGANPNLNGGES